MCPRYRCCCVPFQNALIIDETTELHQQFICLYHYISYTLSCVVSMVISSIRSWGTICVLNGFPRTKFARVACYRLMVHPANERYTIGQVINTKVLAGSGQRHWEEVVLLDVSDQTQVMPYEVWCRRKVQWSDFWSCNQVIFLSFYLTFGKSGMWSTRNGTTWFRIMQGRRTRNTSMWILFALCPRVAVCLSFSVKRDTMVNVFMVVARVFCVPETYNHRSSFMTVSSGVSRIEAASSIIKHVILHV